MTRWQWRLSKINRVLDSRVASVWIALILLSLGFALVIHAIVEKFSA